MARLCHTAGATQSAAVSHDEPDDATAPGHDRDTTTCNLSLRISAAVVARKLVTPYPTASDKLFRDVCHWGAHVLPRPLPSHGTMREREDLAEQSPLQEDERDRAFP